MKNKIFLFLIFLSALCASAQTQEVADEIYVVGAFNDWKNPTLTDLNGAIALEKDYSSENVVTYWGYFELAAGEAKFNIVTLDKTTGEALPWSQKYPSPPFSVYSIDGQPGKAWFNIYNWNNCALSTITISNWQTGIIDLRISHYLSQDLMTVDLKAPNAAPFDIPSQLYGIYDTGNGEREVVPLEVSSEFNYVNNMWAKGPNTTIFFSTENSTEYNPETCWGVPQDTENLENFREYQLVKGGKPFNVDFTKQFGTMKGQLTVLPYWANATAQVNVNEDIYSTYPKEVYVMGSFNHWLYTDKQYVLKAIDDSDATLRTGRVYEGEIELTEENPELRFFVDVNDKVGYISPLYEGEFALNVDLTGKHGIVTSAMRDGYGWWTIRDWTPGKLGIHLSLNEMRDEVEFYRIIDNSGVEEIEADSANPIYYNLQGVRIDSPANGTFIKVTGKRAEKVILK